MKYGVYDTYRLFQYNTLFTYEILLIPHFRFVDISARARADNLNRLKVNRSLLILDTYGYRIFMHPYHVSSAR